MKPNVRPKKHLGQHFLKDNRIAGKIAACLQGTGEYKEVLEIGPGTGVLTQFLKDDARFELKVIELDSESVAYLKEFLLAEEQIIEGDFLKLDLPGLFPEKVALIGNLPYNISSQIFFKLYEYRNLIPEMVCMIQKEVADRIAAPPGNKTYGILSVLLQAFYDIKYEFTVEPGAFNPPPKVRSGVLSLVRNQCTQLDCDEALFFKLVKQGFNNRRKTLRNALKSLLGGDLVLKDEIFGKRAEQLSVEGFVQLTHLVTEAMEARKQ
ncbi:16S rRNA (adenine(1518)-N(6)/adenine(1519)-N(6))-dimethyltransferase RsmA [Rapidithrix thailandica]|uniref:Ribosomal RNA small subunit methyltransferase A n=1 Tax=Rapidithrix thailandica TaxID=413964 RepID=A0AAW9S5A1_9BACT